MFTSLKLRISITIIVCLAALIFLIPTFVSDIPAPWNKFLPREKIHLGLDLQGGMHLVMEVDTGKAIESMMVRTSDNLKESLMNKRIRFRNLKISDNGMISLELTESAAKTDLEKLLRSEYPDLEIDSTSTLEGKQLVNIRLNNKRALELQKNTVEHSLETIRNRVDQFGITEPEIVPQGNNRIMIQLPGIKDPERAKNLIGKTALLEFKLVDDEHSLENALRGNIPEGSMIAYGISEGSGVGQRGSVPYLLKSKTLLTGASLETARVQISDRFGEPSVSLKFSSQGAVDFDRITAENVRRRLAIVLDGVVHSAPVIQERISGGQAQISGNMTMEEARDLAIVLRAGALPAPVNILEERTVGPSLGGDSIRQGIIATIIGSLLVILFMLVYYRLSGAVANIALILNIFMIMAVLAAFRATLTLPGIAGMLLVVGCAVDANILIFERIREELRTGKTVRLALDTGYNRAFITIIDTHITGIVASCFLLMFGTGPIKGFAVTTIIGLLASLFTAVFVTRVIFDYCTQNYNIKKMSI
ncbi:MAG: protein translocase subunit SecD [Smithellaceae bacterium]|jgi:preprotein translocase subunit SecD|nr:protein translocase subunit SecD [Syntrophaceae bacterium]MBP8609869.1 protein translocase subunit SecD [Syntrophaceae bacterium]HPG54210.1 protein translocase subunit SecD [Smithellaceae bacterium]HPM70625.1 protein translocase subunit SecD [Smithellaceae bacterium]HQM42626.1 protein translocase subunit SecD [Smithellaceae bacterium]